jgi:ribose-phosphate pyrophosphokinase
MLANILEPDKNNYFYNNYRSHMINVVDPHSHVFAELCKQNNLNVNIKRQWGFAPSFFGKYDYVVAPDKGAVEKAAQWASILQIPMIPCTKERDPLTGKLTNPSVPNVNYQDKSLLVVDDICDGGFTFNQLAETIRQKHEPQTLDLFVTHGIFSKGLGTLTQWYDKIYTTNSLPHYKKFGTLLGVIDV